MRNKGNARLTDEDVLALRARLRRGESTVEEEAERYNVARETIRKANRGETFRHLKGGTTMVEQLRARDDSRVAEEATRGAQLMYERHMRGELPEASDAPDPYAGLDPLTRARRQAEDKGLLPRRSETREPPPSLLDGGDLPPEEGVDAEAALGRLQGEAARSPAVRVEGMLEDITKGG